MWQDMVMSGLLRNGTGSKGPGVLVPSPCGKLVGSDALQSNSGSICFSFLSFSLMGAAHLAEEIQLSHESIRCDIWRQFAILRFSDDLFASGIGVVDHTVSSSIGVNIHLAWFPKLRLLGT